MTPKPSAAAGDGRSGTLTDEAYRTIKRRIVRLELPPGRAFSEGELARDLGLSKTPVREALLRLQRDRMVEVAARSGYRVTAVTLKDTRDLLALRTLLEGEAAALAAATAVDPAPLQQLEDLCRTSYRPDDPASIDEFLENNTRFHTTVAEIAGNARLTVMLAEILEQLERLFHLGLAVAPRAVELGHEHSELVAAIVAGDPERAREVATAQSRAAQKMVVEALLSSDVLASTNVVPLPPPGTPRGPRSS